MTYSTRKKKKIAKARRQFVREDLKSGIIVYDLNLYGTSVAQQLGVL